MRRWLTVAAACLVVLPAAYGCGGGSESLTGGSVPIGGRTVTGLALLPNGAAAANATVTVRSLPAETLLKSTITDNSGAFTVTGVSTSSDLDITVSLPPSNVLEAVVPQSQLANGGGTLNIGDITATSSIVAAAIKLEQMNAPEDESDISSNQSENLASAVEGQHFSSDMQDQLIGNRNSMNAQALALMTPVANTELTAMNQSPTQANASAALTGLLGYIRAAHNRNFQVSRDLKQSLIDAEIAPKLYSADAVAQALQQSGLPQATAEQVLAASTRERGVLPALATGSGSGISPFEAFVIAADVSTNGGFQCDQNTLNGFIRTLLGS
jgi:hypothetical protein